MNIRTKELLEKHSQDLYRLHSQRRLWLYASSIVFTAIVALIFGWDVINDLHSRPIWWVVISAILIISINWWYWTMRVIRILLTHQQIEYDLLNSIMEEVGEAKEDIKFLVSQNVDNSN